MIRYTDYISPEEYMELRKKVGWTEFPLEQAEACISKAYMIQCVRDDEKAIGVAILNIAAGESAGNSWSPVFKN